MPTPLISPLALRPDAVHDSHALAFERFYVTEIAKIKNNEGRLKWWRDRAETCEANVTNVEGILFGAHANEPMAMGGEGASG
jgi:hypothetical protein